MTSDCTCVVCVRAEQSVPQFHKWTLEPLGTRRRRTNLAQIVYLHLDTMTGMANHVYSLACSLETRKMTSWIGNLSCVLWPAAKFKSHSKWKHFLFVSSQRAWTCCKILWFKENVFVSVNLRRLYLRTRQRQIKFSRRLRLAASGRRAECTVSNYWELGKRQTLLICFMTATLRACSRTRITPTGSP